MAVMVVMVEGRAAGRWSQDIFSFNCVSIGQVKKEVLNVEQRRNYTDD